MMAGWLSLDADGSRDEEQDRSHWQADLPIIAKGNELCKTSCPDCGATLFDLRCGHCGYEETRAVHVVHGTIIAVDDDSLTLRAPVDSIDEALRDRGWIERHDPGLLERAKRQGQPDHGTIEFAHELPVEGLASFASIPKPVEVLAVVQDDALLALEVNG